MPKHCYVYVLRSLKDHQFYVGLTRDLPLRVQQHNKGFVTSTKKRVPFELVYWKGGLNQSDAAHRENISRARGASDISNGDCSSISRGEEPFGLESWFC